MNNSSIPSRLRKAGAIAAALVVMALCASASLYAQSNSRGESFYIISSVNFRNHQIVLMQPTQLTVVAEFGPQTVVLDENGKKLTTQDLKAGDTVWAVVKNSKQDGANVTRIRMGAMTQSELRKLYLKYPANGTPNIPVTPVKPTPQTGAAQPQGNLPPGARINPAMRLPGVPAVRQPAHVHAHPRGPGTGLHTNF